ncbi:MAG: hypothetical protein Q8P35_00620, partial [Candidatus Yanofskybacteria bacterium]|nr:hypothetical protein [Candidatus Yanofskybacteria bacterium]
PDSIGAIARASLGSLRDAENSLAMLSSYTSGKISIKDTTEILGIVPEKINEEMLSVLVKGKTAEAVKIINEVNESGLDLNNFTSQFIGHLRIKLIASIDNTQAGYTEASPKFLAEAIKLFIKAKSELKTSPLPQMPLELAVIELGEKIKTTMV